MASTPDSPIILRRKGFSLFLPVASFLVLGLGFGALAALVQYKNRDLAGTILCCALFAPMSLVFIGWAWSIWRERIFLYVDRIAKYNGFYTRTLMRSEIVGLRIVSDGLSIFANGQRTMRIWLKLLPSDEATAWFDDFDDLDAKDFHEGLQEIAEDGRYGSTPEARVAYILLVRRVARYLQTIAFLVIAWMLIWPHPYLVLVGAAASLPVIALIMYLVTRGGVRFDPRRQPKDARLSLFVVFFFSALTVPFSIFLHDWHILDATPLLAWSGAIGTGTALILAARSESLRRHVWPVVLYAGLLSAYTAGVLAGIDAFFDDTPMTKYPVRVLAVDRSTRFDYLTVNRWGPMSGPDRIGVRGHVNLRRGDLVCIYLRSGRLGFRWYALGDCRGGPEIRWELI